jgi:hypothetical protein
MAASVGTVLMITSRPLALAATGTLIGRKTIHTLADLASLFPATFGRSKIGRSSAGLNITISMEAGCHRFRMDSAVATEARWHLEAPAQFPSEKNMATKIKGVPIPDPPPPPLREAIKLRLKGE